MLVSGHTERMRSEVSLPSRSALEDAVNRLNDLGYSAEPLEDCAHKLVVYYDELSATEVLRILQLADDGAE